MEGGVHKASKNEFRDCLHLSMTRPYILQLALTAGLGGLLFGYDTGVISGALLYIRDDFRSVKKDTNLQEAIVSTAIAGAIVGAGLGGWMNDKWGRKFSILIADVLFFIGAIVMAFAPNPGVIILGRVFVGVGVGMASMTSPLYISESSPARIRGALVSTNGFLICFGQFLSYCINYALTTVPGTWRWMLGIAGVPALVQFILMLALPESPRWLYRKGKKEEAIATLRRIYLANEVEAEIESLKSSVEAEILEEGSIGDDFMDKVKSAWSMPIVRRGLVAGIGVQVAQQIVGINTIMYYSPTIVQLAGFASKSTALALTLITSGLNVVGTVIAMSCVDKFGRRKLMLISMVGIIVCLYALFGVFYGAANTSPHIDALETAHFGNNTCPAYHAAPNAGSWSCVSCLKSKNNCGYCAHSGDTMKPGACLAEVPTSENACKGENRQYYTVGCPSRFGFLAVIGLAAYIISYAPGMGTVPWIVNSEIYPLKFRGLCGGMAAMANWTANLIVSQTFLSLTTSLGSSFTFFLFGCVSIIAILFIFFCVPETKGLSFEQVEEMLESKILTYPRKKQPEDHAT